MKLHTSKTVFIAVVMNIVLFSARLMGGTGYSWNGGSGNWTETGNWTPSGYPGQAADDSASFSLNGGTVTVGADLPLAAITVTSNQNWTWSGANTLTVTGAFNYGSSGASTFSALLAGNVLNVTTGTLTLSNGGNTYTGGTTIVNATLNATAVGCLGPSGVICVESNGTLNQSVDGLNRNITLKGGTYNLHATGGNFLLQDGTTSYINESGYGGNITGVISGGGKVVLTGDAVADWGLSLYTNTHTGGTVIQSGKVHMVTADALGSTGEVVVKPAGKLIQYFGDYILRDITLDGGLYSANYAARMSGNIRLTADSSYSGGGDWSWIEGRIWDDGTPSKLKFYGSYCVLKGSSNTWSGGSEVYTALYAQHTNALGFGPVTLYATNLMLAHTSAVNWDLPNDLRGTGTIKVEDGSGSYTLSTVGGTVSAGTTGAVGALRIDGGYSFANNGSSNAMLLVRIKKPGGSATNNLLVVDHNLGGLSSATLMVDVDGSIGGPELSGEEFTVATCANDLTGQFFGAQLWSETTNPSGRWKGTVVCGNGFIKLKDMYVATAGTIMIIR